MSKKKRPAKTVPAPESTPKTWTLHAGSTDLSPWVRSFSLIFGNGNDVKVAPPLADAIADQIGAMTADFDGSGRAELPRPERDLETYRDAFAAAAANCLHEDATELLYQREWVCDACGRMLNRDDMRRAMNARSPWWMV